MALNLHGVNIRANNMSSNFMYLAAGLMLLQGALFTFKPEIPITDSWGAKFANNQEMRVMHQALGGMMASWGVHILASARGHSSATAVHCGHSVMVLRMAYDFFFGSAKPPPPAIALMGSIWALGFYHAVSLPSRYKIIRLHEVQSLETRKLLIAQVHDVIRQNYGSYADSESAVQWLDNLAKSGLNSADPLCKLLVTMLLDADGGALGFSSAEVLPAGNRRYIYNAYTCVRHGAAAVTDEENLAVIQIVKQDIALCARELRDVLAQDGVHVQASFQDHMLYQPSHLPKIRVGFAVGQVPLGTLGFNNYQLPIYSCEVPSTTSGKALPMCS